MVLFENNYFSTELKYSIRTTFSKQLRLHNFIDKDGNDIVSSTFIKKAPFVQLQHCLDIAFIEMASNKKIPPINVCILILLI